MRKKTDPTERAKKAAEALAKVRIQQVNFTSKELTDALRINGFPYFIEGVSMLKKLGLIAKDSDGYYFTTKEPIHFSKLRASLDELCLRYGRKLKEIEKEIVPEEKFAYLVAIENEITVILSEEKLIEFIKKNRTMTVEKTKIYG